VLLVGLLLVAWNLLQSLRKGAPAPMNPWGGATLEWQCSSPPPHHNFDEQPEVGDPYEIEQYEWDPAEQGYVRRATPVSSAH
jgi:cytochrome c oxidase subunit I